ncbi:MAG: alpha/beta hydrolase [Pseudorhodobacter sp.]
MGYDPKYDDLIDDETWAFIRETESWYPPDAIGLSIAGQREVYDAMCRAFHAGHPPGVVATDSAIAPGSHSIPLRTYRCGGAGLAQVLYVHGGGFVLGGLDSHDDVCAEICARTGFDVTAVDYRLSPEHPFPCDFNDALAAARSLSAKPVVLAGDSAGGDLCAAVAAALRGTEFAPIGQVLIYPGLGAPVATQSAVEHAHAPMLTAQDMAFYSTVRAGGDETAQDNPSFSPLRAADFSGLPPTIAITAQCDPLSDDGKHYCERVAAAGGMAKHIEEQGLVHGYLRARHRVTRAGASFDRIVAAISALGRGDWPESL